MSPAAEPGSRELRLRAAVASLLEPTNSPQRNRAAWVLLGVAIAIYTALVLWLTRDSIAQIDGIDWFADAIDGFDPGSLAAPHNGHPNIPTRFVHTLTLHLFGPEQFFIELFAVIAVAASALVLFLLLKKRVDSLLALAPAVLILFLGTTTTPVDPNISAFAQSTALGLGAFLALERRDRIGDLIGFGLLLVVVLTFTLGLPFALGAGVLVGASPDWRRRAWVVLVPLVVFGIWFLWARRFGEGTPTHLQSFVLIPAFAMDNLAAAFAALTGLDREFVSPDGYGLIDLGWGRILAAGFIGLSILEALRGRFSARALACVVVLIAFWTVAALAQGVDRYPQSVRYVFVTAVLCIVIGYELLLNYPVTRRVSIALLVLLVLSLPVNVDRMRYTGAVLRQVSLEEAAEFTAIELQRDRVQPGLRTSNDSVTLIDADRYLELSDRFGSLATPPAELPLQLGPARARADAALGAILTPRVTTPLAPPTRDCREVRRESDAPLEIQVPTGRALIRADEGGQLLLRRFGDLPTIEAGTLTAERFAQLELPADASSQPWVASIEGAGSVEICK